MTELVKEVDKISALWNYTAKKHGGKEATKILAHLGLDNPHVTKTRSLENCRSLVDKFMWARRNWNEKL